jgi:predicted dehydrogenase
LIDSIETEKRFQAQAFDDYRQLAGVSPDAILIEVPHNVQDRAAAWVIDQGWHLLLGGPLARNLETARDLARSTARRGLTVEAGFEARYKPVWAMAKSMIASGTLGPLVAGEGTAFFGCDPKSWYYDEELSGGMPLTHMTYCFINPLRWILGEPLAVSAMANQIVNQSAHAVHEETCGALLRFSNRIIVSLTAGYVRSTNCDVWRLRLYGRDGALEILPDESGPGCIRLLRGDGVEEHKFPADEDGFLSQAEAFIAAIRGKARCLNRPMDCIGDLAVVEAIRKSVNLPGTQIVFAQAG